MIKKHLILKVQHTGAANYQLLTAADMLYTSMTVATISLLAHLAVQLSELPGECLGLIGYHMMKEASWLAC